MAEKSRYIRGNANPEQGDWQNPRLTGRNKIEGRFEELPLQNLPSSPDQLPGEAETPWVHSLNGDWNFSWYSCPSDVPEGVYAADYSDKDWNKLPVPSNWEMHGHGIPQYNNVVFPYSHDIENPPAIDPKDNPTGVYRTDFKVPAQWKDRWADIILRFEGVRSAAHVYLNGEEIAYTQNSYSPAEIKIGPFLKKGRNQLTIVVYKWCAGTYLEDQDMWRLGGIFRPVSLIAPIHGGIFDVFARCRFDSSLLDANFTVGVILDSAGDKVPVGRSVRWYLYEAGNEDIVASGPALSAVYQNENRSELEHNLIVHEPKKWSAEEPNLYRLVVELSEEDGTVVDLRSVAYGFRQIDIVPGPQGAMLEVNGRPVKLRGVNRHEIHPKFGQAVPASLTESDLILMKRNNINAVRCSHYPNSRNLYEIANRLGLYVIDEANLESHGLRAELPSSLPEWTDNCIDRMERMVLAHRNHPCIVLWSLGNEAGHGDNFRKMKKAARNLDNTRPIHYEGDHKLDTSDVFSLMYPTPKKVEQIGRCRTVRVAADEGNLLGWRISRRQYHNKPFILCEFSHAMGNSLGNFAEYMELVEKYPNIAGAFIWDFSDQALYKQAGDGTEFLAYGGEFGEQPHDGIFCANGIVDAERRPQPELAEVRALYSPVVFAPVDLKKGIVEVINRNAHADLRGYEISWVLERDGVPVAEGSIRKPDIPAGESKAVNIYRDLAAYPGIGEGYLLFSVRLKEKTSWAETGYELSRLQLPVPEVTDAEQPADIIFDHLKPLEPVVEDDSDAPDSEETEIGSPEKNPVPWRFEKHEGYLIIAGAGMGLRVRLADAALETLDFGMGNVLVGPLEPDFYRAATDNEKGGLAQFIGESTPENPGGKRLAKLAYRIADVVYGRHWESAARCRKIRGYRISRTEDGLRIRFSLRIPGFLGPVILSYSPSSSGEVSVSLKGLPWREMVRFGSRMIIPGRYRDVSWYGRGPQECYVDRKAGAVVACHRMDAEELSHNYLMPQESGNRTEVRRVSFSDGGSAVSFRAPEGRHIDFSAAFASREQIQAAGHVHEIEFSPDLHVHIDGGQRGVGGAYPGVLGLMGKYKMKAFRSRSFRYSILRETPGAEKGRQG